MKALLIKLFLGSLITSLVCASEFSEEKIHYYASLVRIPEEGKTYLRGIPPEEVRKIVDQLNFEQDGRGKNMHFFGFVCSKIRQFEESGDEYGKDYVIPRMVKFVRACLEKGDVLTGANALSSFESLNLNHPEIVELAEEIRDSENEYARNNAESFLKSLKINNNKRRSKNKESDKNNPEKLERETFSHNEEKSENNRNWVSRNPLIWMVSLIGFILTVLFIRFYRRPVK